jgi:hypothetical protein
VARCAISQEGPHSLAPVIYLAGGAASLVSPVISLAIFFTMAVYWAAPNV